jgi:hypothetical protein
LREFQPFFRSPEQLLFADRANCGRSLLPTLFGSRAANFSIVSHGDPLVETLASLRQLALPQALNSPARLTFQIANPFRNGQGRSLLCALECRGLRPLPHYFFHIEGKFPFRDEVGTELRDDRAAWKEALLLTRDIETSLQPGQSWSLDVLVDCRLLYRIGITSEER